MNSRTHRVRHARTVTRQPSRTARVLARCFFALTGASAGIEKRAQERFAALAPDQRVREMGEW
ncbi:hypothetical protein BH11PSE13_BH11PSE13_04340 [soil metagenome]